jgi:hypothetical protein
MNQKPYVNMAPWVRRGAARTTLADQDATMMRQLPTIHLLLLPRTISKDNRETGDAIYADRLDGPDLRRVTL